MEVLISPDALAKQAELAYVGNTYRMFLAFRDGAALTQASLMSVWYQVKLDNGVNGYNDLTGTIGAGAWNSSNARYELPQFQMALTATGAGFTFDAIVLQVANRTYPDRVVLLPQAVTMQSGQARTYVLLLAQG